MFQSGDMEFLDVTHVDSDQPAIDRGERPAAVADPQRGGVQDSRVRHRGAHVVAQFKDPPPKACQSIIHRRLLFRARPNDRITDAGVGRPSENGRKLLHDLQEGQVRFMAGSCSAPDDSRRDQPDSVTIRQQDVQRSPIHTVAGGEQIPALIDRGC